MRWYSRLGPGPNLRIFFGRGGPRRSASTHPHSFNLVVLDYKTIDYKTIRPYSPRRLKG